MRSKRQRKQKVNNSLKRKAGAAALDEGGRQDLSDAVLADGGDGEAEGGSNALALQPKARPAEPEVAPEGRRLSKAEQRKLKQIARDRELKAQRQEALAMLAEHQLPEQQQALLRPSARLGQRETKRQRIAREFSMQKAGLPLPADAALQRRRPAVGAEHDSAEVASQLQQQPAAAQPRSRSPDSGASASGDGSDSEAGDSDAPVGGREQASPQPAQPPVAAALRQAAAQARVALGLPQPAAAEAAPAAAAAAAAGGSAQPSGRQRLVPVARPAAVSAARQKLPIVGMEQEVMEAIGERDVAVLAGETGCGKTTQVPQFLYEAGYGCPAFPDRAGMVGVTQPRRVAAIASAHRVAAELGTPLGAVVGYQVRHDRRVGSSAAVKFMTDGVLLREAQGDFLLSGYSCICIDEAHERSLNTDLLIGMLSRIVPLRRRMAGEGATHKGRLVQPLKLVIMSATLRTGDFLANARLFPRPPPLVTVAARQFPVTVHFARRTELRDYVGAAFAKVSQIHRQQPAGGILVFLTGRQEVEQLCRRLREAFARQQPAAAAAAAPTAAAAAAPAAAADAAAAAPAAAAAAAPAAADAAAEPGEAGGGDAAGLEGAFGEDEAEAADAEQGLAEADESEDDYEAGGYLSEEEETQVLGGGGFSAEELAAAEARLTQELGWQPQPPDAAAAAAAAATGAPAGEAAAAERQAGPLHVLPLYAMLPRAAQDRVFGAVPPGHRLVVVATNVAETSLTIPGIRYVVDTGRAKQKLLEPASGTARYEVGWISQASAEQRAGRAGRMAPGHCFRLFSSAVFNDQFAAHSPPEILNTALEGVVLVMKAMGIDKVDNFPFPTPPEAGGLAQAQACLLALGALQPGSLALTETGRSMAALPIAPRSARLILQAAQAGKRQAETLAYAVALAAATSLETPFAQLQGAGQEQRASVAAAQAALRQPSGDALSALAALLTFEAAPSKAEVCESHGLHARSLGEMAALHSQLRRILAAQLPGAQLGPVPQQPRPPPAVAAALCRAIAAGWADRVARRARSGERAAAGGAGGRTKAVRYQALGAGEEPVFLHPRSSLAAAPPAFAVAMQLVRSPKRVYMAGVTEIEAHWLPEVAAPLCTVSEPLEQPPPAYAPASDAVLAWHDACFGPAGWPLPRLRRLLPDAAARARAFAAALLEGTVLPSMAELRPLLAATPAAAAKAEAQGLARIGRLTAALQAAGIDSRAALAAAWQRQPQLLQPELAAWLRKGQAGALLRLWPRLLQESAAPPAKAKAAERKRKERPAQA